MKYSSAQCLLRMVSNELTSNEMLSNYFLLLFSILAIFFQDGFNLFSNLWLFSLNWKFNSSTRFLHFDLKFTYVTAWVAQCFLTQSTSKSRNTKSDIKSVLKNSFNLQHCKILKWTCSESCCLRRTSPQPLLSHPPRNATQQGIRNRRDRTWGNKKRFHRPRPSRI